MTSGPAKADTTAQLEAEKTQLLNELAVLAPGVDSAQAALNAAENAFSQQSTALSAAQATLGTVNVHLATLNGQITDEQFQAASAQQALAALTRATYESVSGNTVMTAILSAKDFNAAMASLSGASQVTSQIQGLEKTLAQEEANLLSAQRQVQADFAQASALENQLSDQANALAAVVAQRNMILAQLDGPALQLASQIAQIDAELNPVPGVSSTGTCGDSFVFGNCTWYVASRRCIPWGGNAVSWYYSAAKMGYLEGQTPAVGAVAVWGAGEAGANQAYGHVAYVEAVGPGPAFGTLTGDIIPAGFFEVSEMNWFAGGGGWDRVDYRLVSDSSVMGFIYGSG